MGLNWASQPVIVLRVELLWMSLSNNSSYNILALASVHRRYVLLTLFCTNFSSPARHENHKVQILIPFVSPNNANFKSNSNKQSNSMRQPLFSFTNKFFLTATTTTLIPQKLEFLSLSTVLRSRFTIRNLLQLQSHLITTGLFKDPHISTRILQHSAELGHIDHSLLIFRYIGKPDTLTVNAVIKAFSVSSNPGKAVDFYFQCLKDEGLLFLPNSYTFVPILNACGKMGCVLLGEKYHAQVVKNGVDHVMFVQNSLIHMYGCLGVLESMSKVFLEMGDRDLVSYNSVVDGFAKSGDMGKARKVFDAMPERNVVSWNVVITGYLKAGNPGRALKLFRNMVKSGLRGSDTTLVIVLTACGRSGRLKEGRSVHGFLFRGFVKSSVVTETALIDMYSKCEKVEAARKVFDRMSFRNLVCWNAMIVGHCVHGNPDEGLSLFSEMVDQLKDRENANAKKIKPNAIHVIPDRITFIGVLCACARAGLLTEGKMYFSKMINEFHIKPNFAHLWCVANLLVGKGLIQEAQEVLRSLPEDDEDVSPESSLWANLFASCRFQGDVTLGERIASSLIELDPKNFQNYRLLMNIYAVAGRWEDVARVKTMIKERRVERMPGCNLQDLNEIIHKFQARDHWQGDKVADNMIGELAQS